jgi:hypothetical protein
MIEKTKKLEGKCNLVVNNLLAKMLYHCDKQKLLFQAAELIYTLNLMISTEKVGKLLLVFGKLFLLAPPSQRSKYLSGSLFALGGLLKLEAKSYLQTLQSFKKEDDPTFEVPCPLFTADDESEIQKMEKQRVRNLSSSDILFYENELLEILLDFTKNLVKPS